MQLNDANVKKALRRLGKARTLLLSKLEFFEPLVLKTKIVIDDSIKTAGMTFDGIMYANTAFILSCTVEQLAGLLLHEHGHLFNCHPERSKDKIHRLANIAGDMAMNQFITEIFPLPADGVSHTAHGFPAGLSLEGYYRLLLVERKGSDKAKKEASTPGSGGDCGSCAHGSQGDNDDAAVARRILEEMGSPPDVEGLTHAIEETQKSYRSSIFAGTKAGSQLFPHVPPPRAERKRTCWDMLRRTLREEMTVMGNVTDYSKRRRSRRSFTRGMVVPGLVSFEPALTIVIDTSGSMSFLLPTILTVVYDIAKSLGMRKVELVHTDTVVQHTETIPISALKEVKLRGGGGTDFRAVFKYLDARKRPDLVVFITDLYATFPRNKPKYRVLWAATHNVKPPWGEVVYLNGRDKL